MKRTVTGIILCVCLLFMLAGSVTFCLAASRTKANAPTEDNDPIDTVSEFFEAIERKDYDTYTDYLYECKSLGLENEPEDKTEKILWNEFRSGFSHEIKGTAVTEYDRARVNVRVSGLSLSKFSEDVKKKTKANISRIMDNPSEGVKIFDENGDYLEDFITEQYNKAIEETLKDGKKYRSDTEITVELVYIQGKWKIVVSDELAETLNGSKFM